MAVETSPYRPADYYASATPQRVLPQWATYGCGGVALLALIVVFVGGAFLAGDGLPQLMDMAFGMTMGELRGMYTKDVTPAQKAALEKEIATMRKNVREEKIFVQSLQPVLRAIQKATGDEKVNAQEIDTITKAARTANATQKRK